MRKCVRATQTRVKSVHTSSDRIHRASRLMRNFGLHRNDRHSHTLKRTFGSKWGIVGLLLWAHNDNDARQSWTITGSTLSSRKRLSRRTVTHGVWLQTLGVPFESGITVAFRIVFTGLYQIYAWDRKSLDKQRGITCALQNTVSRKTWKEETCDESAIVLFWMSEEWHCHFENCPPFWYIKPLVCCWDWAIDYVARQFFLRWLFFF